MGRPGRDDRPQPAVRPDRLAPWLTSRQAAHPPLDVAPEPALDPDADVERLGEAALFPQPPDRRPAELRDLKHLALPEDLVAGF